jgi:hypothetical protein
MFQLENHRSTDRFINPKLKRNMNAAGTSAIRAAPTASRVRNRDPSALLRWSINSLMMLRINSTRKASSTRNTITEVAVKTRISVAVCGVSHRLPRGLKAFSAASADKITNAPAASHAIVRRRGLPKSDMPRL